MQLDQAIQQHVAKMPNYLQAEVFDFVLFLEERQKKQLNQNTNQTEQELFALMSVVPSSVSLVDELIQERRLEAKKELQENTL